jgi:hypothetical protein
MADFGGTITDKGALVFDDQPRWRAQLAQWIGKRVVVEVFTWKAHTSVRQHRWWRGVIVPSVAWHEAKKRGLDTAYPLDAIHDLLVRTFWPCVETPLGAMRVSTKDLTTAEMAELCTLVQAHYAQDRPPLNIPSPDDPPVGL